jgi:hypothetical protein
MLDWPLLAGDGAADRPAGDTCSDTIGLAKHARELMHELNNDFTVVMASLELLDASTDLPPSSQTLLAAAWGQMERATKRIDAFQRIARAYPPDA